MNEPISRHLPCGCTIKVNGLEITWAACAVHHNAQGMADLLAEYACKSQAVETPTPNSLIARTRTVLDTAGVMWRD